jgi:hypothetical protein
LKRWLLAGVPLLGVALIANKAASIVPPGDPSDSSTYNTFSATGCVAENSTSAGKISYSQFGVQNDNTSSSATVWCSIPIDHLPLIERGLTSPPLMLYGYARDRNGGSAQDVSCTLYQLKNDGNVLWSWGPWKTSGSGTTYQSLKLSNGDRSIEYFDVQDQPQPATAVSFVAKCTIPAKSTSGVSSLISFQLRFCQTTNCQ